MPFFSIILPTYNSGVTIKECLDSILSQTFVDFEILIMDGISCDETIDIAQSYNDNRIKITIEKDYGVYDAMNKAIDKANGEWLYFLGSDDKLYDNDVLNNISAFIKEEKSDVVYGDAFFLSSNTLYDGLFDRKKLIKSNNICHQALFYKKNIFERLGKYNLYFPIYADWDFNIRCFSTPDLKIDYINLPIAYYNDLSGISHAKIDEIFFDLSCYGLLRDMRKQKQEINTLLNNMHKSSNLKDSILKPFKFVKNLIFK